MYRLFKHFQYYKKHLYTNIEEALVPTIRSDTFLILITTFTARTFSDYWIYYL